MLDRYSVIKREDVEEDTSTMDYFSDIPRGFANGVVGFGQSILSLADSGVEAFGGDLVDDDVLEHKVFGESRTIVGSLVEGITQFAAALIPGGAAVKWAGLAGKMTTLAKSGTLVNSLATGAVADFLAFQGHEARLSNLLTDVPILRDIGIFEYLAADDDDGEVEGRFKNVIEGLGLGAAGHALFQSLKVFKVGSRVKAAVGMAGATDEEVAKATTKALADATKDGRLGDVIARMESGRQGAVDAAGEAVELGGVEAGGRAAAQAAAQEPAVAVEFASKAELQEMTNILVRAKKTGKKINVTEMYRNRNINWRNREKWHPEDTMNAFKVIHQHGEATHNLRTGGAARTLEDMSQYANHIARSPDEAARLIDNTLDYVSNMKGGEDLFLANGQFEVALSSDIASGIREITLTGASNVNRTKVLLSMHSMTQLQELQNEIATIAARITAIGGAKGRLRPGREVADEAITAVLAKTAKDQPALNAILTNAKLSKDAKAAAIVKLHGGAKHVDDTIKKMAMIDEYGNGFYHASELLLQRGQSKLLAVHNEIWLNFILSGFPTHTVNFGSTGINTVLRPTERLIGGALAADPQAMGDALTHFVGLWKAKGDAWRGFWRTLKTGQPTLDPTNLPFLDSNVRAIGSVTDLGEMASHTAGKLRGEMSVMQTATSWLGNIVNMPMRFLGAEDEFWKQLSYRASLYSEFTREGIERGMKSDALQKHVANRIADSFDKLGKGTHVGALAEARSATWTSDLAGMGRTVQEMVNKHPTLRLVAPFVRTPWNLMDDMTSHTPGLQLFKRTWRADVAAGGARRAQAFGRFATGVSLTTVAALAASQGVLTGAGPRDKRRREQLYETGWQPYSLVTTDETGKKHYTAFGRMEPHGSLLGLVTDMVEVMGVEGMEAEGQNILAALSASVANNIVSKTYLRGVAEVANLLVSPGDWHAMQAFRSRAASYVPNILAKADPDPLLREVSTISEAIRARIPGLSETLAPKRNVLGEVVEQGDTLGPRFISPVYESEETGDSVFRELVSLDHGFALPSKRAREVVFSDYSNAEGQDAYDRYVELHSEVKVGGRSLRERLDKLFGSQSYQRARGVPEEQVSRTREIIGSHRRRAFRQLQKEFPKLARDLKYSRLRRRLGDDRAGELMRLAQ